MTQFCVLDHFCGQPVTDHYREITHNDQGHLLDVGTKNNAPIKPKIDVKYRNHGGLPLARRPNCETFTDQFLKRQNKTRRLVQFLALLEIRIILKK